MRRLPLTCFTILASGSFLLADKVALPPPVTSLVEILSVVEEFALATGLEIPRPLSTNSVTRYVPPRGNPPVAGVRIDDRFGFSLDVQHRTVIGFMDHKHAVSQLWRPEDMRPLLKPPKLNAEQAVELAREYLRRLGFEERDFLVHSPSAKPWYWQPVGQDHKEQLPFYSVEWPWKVDPARPYFRMEIDGLRERLNYFATMYGSPAEASAGPEGQPKRERRSQPDPSPELGK